MIDDLNASTPNVLFSCRRLFVWRSNESCLYLPTAHRFVNKSKLVVETLKLFFFLLFRSIVKLFHCRKSYAKSRKPEQTQNRALKVRHSTTTCFSCLNGEQAAKRYREGCLHPLHLFPSSIDEEENSTRRSMNTKYPLPLGESASSCRCSLMWVENGFWCFDEHRFMSTPTSGLKWKNGVFPSRRRSRQGFHGFFLCV